MNQERNRPVTAEDLILRYDLEKLKTLKKQFNQLSDVLQNENMIIKYYVQNVSRYSNQNNSTTWFYSGTPTLENEPFISFEDNVSDHVGDLYYDRDTGNVYILNYEDNDYSWDEVDDVALVQSLAIANSEADAQDNKRSIFYDTPSTPYEVGDIWIKDNVIMRCRCSRTEGTINLADWIEQEYYSDTNVILDVRAILNQFQREVTQSYITNVQLEATKDNIMSNVEGITRQIETDLSGVEQNVTEVVNSVQEIQSTTSQTIEVVREITENGVTKVDTQTGFVFDKDGLSIDSINSPVKSNLDEAGLAIISKIAAALSTIFYTGYVNQDVVDAISSLADYLGQTVTYTENLIFKNYLSSKNVRLEDVESSTYGKGLGFFVIGGDS